ncbi:hypothetical protein [Aquirufa ecclesiirivi]|uniref:hypothetical protein n=1 Tax=Aquirufa ecclesiirivi TaxID=2715124 RepID=UPI0023D84EF6|nr:hypothetical protein [Aquirufa ecclesiirivi]MDF0692726.1 hypothetical protein [Aquirufa ecclesiirivi]
MFRTLIFFVFVCLGMSLSTQAQKFSNSKGDFSTEVKNWMLLSRNKEAPAVADLWMAKWPYSNLNAAEQDQFEKLIKTMPSMGFKSPQLAYLFIRCTVQFSDDAEALKSLIQVWGKLVEKKDFRTALTLAETVENWQYNQQIPGLASMSIRVKGRLLVTWPSDVLMADSLGQKSVDNDGWDTPGSSDIEAPNASDKNWLVETKTGGPVLLWKFPEINYKTGRDSLNFSPKTFQWSVLNKIGKGSDVEIAGELLGYLDAKWKIKSFEILPKKGQLVGLEGDWFQFEKNLAGKGKLSLKRKSNSLVFPFEFRSIDVMASPIQEKSWRANGRLWILGDKRGLISSTSQTAYFQVLSDKQVVGQIKTKLMWLSAEGNVNIPEGQFVAYMGSRDTLQHPSIRANWYPLQELLHIRKIDGGPMERLLFEDTYHQVRISVDLAILHPQAKKVDFFRLSGKNQVPAWVESFDYFEESRLTALQGILNYNPLRILYNQIIETKSPQVYLRDIAVKYKRDYAALKSGFMMYRDAGYIQYQHETDQISFTKMGRHYALVQFEKKDFDRFYVASFADMIEKDSANISLELSRQRLIVRGIDEIRVSDSLKANFVPQNKQIVFTKGRDFDFQGEIKVGNYRFRGPNFQFNFAEFTVNFPKIDSITFLPRLKDGSLGTRELGGHFKYESGMLQLSPPNNKSGRLGVAAYPKLVIPKGVTTYFDESWRAQGLYGKKYYFKVPRIELDSLLLKDITFDGSFFSDGLLPVLKTKLELMPDQSFGFKYSIKSPLDIYKSQAKFTFNEVLLMDREGLHASGNLAIWGLSSNTKTTTFYPDSLVAKGLDGKLTSMYQGKNMFPTASFGVHHLHWYPAVDSLWIYPQKNRIGLYNNQIQLAGNLGFHQKKVFGQGQVFYGDGVFSSQNFLFSSNAWQSDLSDVKIGRQMNLFKPSVYAQSISVEAIMGSQKVSMRAKKSKALSDENSTLLFPFIGYQSTISEATWDLAAQRFKLSGKSGFELSQWSADSTMFSQDSTTLQKKIAYSDKGLIRASTADYDLKAQVLQLGGVKQVGIGPAIVFPAKGLLAIQKDGQFKPFIGARAILDPDNKRHIVSELQVSEANADGWKGEATYLLPRASGDSTKIKMRNFSFVEEAATTKKAAEKYIQAEAVLSEKVPLALSAHQQFKGEIFFKSNQEILNFKGFIRPVIGLSNFKAAWIPFENQGGESPNLKLSPSLRDEAGRPVTAGIFINADNKLYPTFLGPQSDDLDPVLYSAEGEVMEEKDFYQVKGKQSDMKLYVKERRLEAEGAVQLFTGNKLLTSFGKISMSTDTLIPRLETWTSLQFPFAPTILKIMGDRIVKYNLEEGLSTTSADEPELRDDYLKRAEQVLGKAIPEAIKSKMDQNHLALDKVSLEFGKSINFSAVKWAWSPNLSAFYSLGGIPLVNVGPVDVNSTLKGYMEVIKKPSKEEFYGYWELSEDLWYYFAYFNGELGVYSSDNQFLAAVREAVKNEKKDKKEGEVRVVEAASDEKAVFVKKFLTLYRQEAPVKKQAPKSKVAPKATPKTSPTTKPKTKSGGF